MILKDVYNILRSGELRSQSNETTAISDQSITFAINMGIIELIKRFPILYKEAEITLKEDVYTYQLPTDVTTIVAAYDAYGRPIGINQAGWSKTISVRDKLNIDASYQHLGSQILVIYKPTPAYRVWTEAHPGTTTMNPAKASVSAVKSGTRVTETVDTVLTATTVDRYTYRSDEDYKLYLITDKRIIGEKLLELAIPESLLEALTQYVAWRMSQATITTNPKAPQFYYQLFEQSCLRVTMESAVTPEGVYNEAIYNLHAKGFNTHSIPSSLIMGDL
jgi:hypothetical protein